LRVTFGGGGSDLVLGRGVCIAATIDKYVTVSATENWDDRYLLHYSDYENVPGRDEIRHRLIRSVLEFLDVGPGVQITSTADIPAGTGLGSSGAFTVGLLKALRPDVSRPQLARWACDLDIGQQDQWSAVYGGVNLFEFESGTIRPIETTIDRHLVLYYTGMRHDAAQVLTGPQKSRHTAYAEVKAMVGHLEADDLQGVGDAFTSQWSAKYLRCPTPEHEIIDQWIRLGCEAGAYGGKLIGAGGGGFVMFATEVDLDAVVPLRRVPFRFTYDGCR
jgi:D-glycero-alpha-D-manno-heptose-7-phosphate kinase